MTDEQIDLLLDGIRLRRNQRRLIVQTERARKEEYKREKLEGDLDKYSAMADKALAKLDKAIEEFEKRVNQVRAVKLQLDGVLD